MSGGSIDYDIPVVTEGGTQGRRAFYCPEKGRKERWMMLIKEYFWQEKKVAQEGKWGIGVM